MSETSAARRALWGERSEDRWRDALRSYRAVVAKQGVARLTELDAWYRDELPPAIAARRAPHVTLAELTRLTEWKMARGVWRAPNLVLVRGNDADAATTISTEALAAAPHPTTPIALLSSLAGVGAATASAVASAHAPDVYPFFDELVAGQVPGLGAVKWTLRFYAGYADALRERATRLGADWTPTMVERALWASVGGKRGDAALAGAH
ncbi:MAG TPA: hypothetical protein VL328_05170 [Gemmatimonadaceae bacterium]|jgi:hypothetical protein|nr:hypothetical protein [Gemmatimonadaceae bacterium]